MVRVRVGLDLKGFTITRQKKKKIKQNQPMQVGKFGAFDHVNEANFKVCFDTTPKRSVFPSDIKPGFFYFLGECVNHYTFQPLLTRNV